PTRSAAERFRSTRRPLGGACHAVAFRHQYIILMIINMNVSRTRSAPGTIRAARPRKTSPDRLKANGVHYTPPDLAGFLASSLFPHVTPPPNGPIYVLDPACGDGSLLMAFAQATPTTIRKRPHLVGYDTDTAALAKASEGLDALGEVRSDLRQADFLSLP